MKTLLIALTGLVLVLSGCQSTSAKYEKIIEAYTEAHLADPKRGYHVLPCCEATGSKIGIASGGKHATQAGLTMIAKGGNIVDAAVAVAFGTAVERPAAAGIGGGGFMTLHLKGPTGIEEHFIDFRETAPKKATRDMYLDEKGEVVPDKSLDGALSIGTPGFVAGMYELHKRWGQLPWKEVLQPALDLARNGFPVTRDLSERIEFRKELLLKEAYTKALLYKAGKPLAEGSLFIQKDLANTIEKIANKGRDGFYKGEIATKMVAYLARRGGILSKSDLSDYEVKFRKPIKGNYQGYDYLSAPPPSAGGVLLAEMTNMLSRYDLLNQATNSADYNHLLAEVMSRAYADRSLYIGDPDFVDYEFLKLTELDYAKVRASDIDLVAHTPSAQVKPGKLGYQEAPNTSHFSLIDEKGNAVACTLSINYIFGSGLATPGVGVFMNDEMDDFSAKPGVKNVFGLTGNEANAIEPGKRMVSSMSPTIFLKDSMPVLALGAAGGSKIISSTLQVALNYLMLYPGDLKKSMFAPRMHFQWVPDVFYYESDGYEKKMVDAMMSKGFEVRAEPAGLARVNAVSRNAAGVITAVSDPRDSGSAGAK